MWAKIFNDPNLQKDEQLSSVMKDDMNFELTYHKVMKMHADHYTNTQKTLLHEAVLAAYDEMHDAVFHVEGAVAGLNVYLVSEWLKFMYCNEGDDKKALWFTLNQDLFFERWFRGWPVRCPGATPFPLEAYPRGQGENGKADHLDDVFDRSHFVTLDSNITLENVENAIESGPPAAYIKVHGSYGWKSSNGQETMVLGYDKEDSIESEPLLWAYYQLLGKAIVEGDKRLLVIGYGFQDEHIKHLLCEGILRHGLKLYVLRPTDPKDFKSMMLANRNEFHRDIWTKGLCGYFQYSFGEMFRKENKKLWTQIKQSMTA